MSFACLYAVSVVILKNNSTKTNLETFQRLPPHNYKTLQDEHSWRSSQYSLTFMATGMARSFQHTLVDSGELGGHIFQGDNFLFSEFCPGTNFSMGQFSLRHQSWIMHYIIRQSLISPRVISVLYHPEEFLI